MVAQMLKFSRLQFGTVILIKDLSGSWYTSTSGFGDSHFKVRASIQFMNVGSGFFETPGSKNGELVVGILIMEVWKPP